MKRLLLILTVALFAFAITALAEDVKLVSTPTTPAATGDVNFHHDRNGNTSMELKVDHLAAPTSLVPAKSYYVVWIQAPGHDPENKGVLSVNENLQGDIKTVSPYQQFTIFVTAENTPSVQSPSGPTVLKGTVNNR